MRLATASDEVSAKDDSRVQRNPTYLTIILLSKMITKLGCLDVVTVNIIENLFMVDFVFLLEKYKEINEINIVREIPENDRKASF